MPLAPGDPFPQLKVESVDGRVELRDRWREGPLVVMFMRHFGCAFCREHLIRMGKAVGDFEAAGAQVVAIFQYSAEATRDFCASRKVPFDCLGDPKREAYQQVEVGKGTREQVLGRAIAGKYLKTILRSRVVGSVNAPVDEMLQLPGTFVVGTDGRVLFSHYAVNSADNPPVTDVLSVVRKNASSRSTG
ncbi:AhpC/TSA family protein [Solirubrobacter phytolaccae]|uniref:AhpC/TSA family protein n=1 Tax=Solirubrobacter phytolaccae TaxID=1404360 RepID=A0A9X3NF53_9ACTN|nr:peroxiredoxin-like family protein [Solirubrobacter phytolaccae]MDA0184979.1 AhpC/TSA family protein [Solirubrobacter phytolaccae]